MRKTMNIWCVIVVCACVLIGFFWFNRSLTADLEELDALQSDAKLRLSALQAEQTELEAQLDAVDTDAFIENQARTMYGYMMPDEIRFVITNPEALYGDEEMPSR